MGNFHISIEKFYQFKNGYRMDCLTFVNRGGFCCCLIIVVYSLLFVTSNAWSQNDDMSKKYIPVGTNLEQTNQALLNYIISKNYDVIWDANRKSLIYKITVYNNKVSFGNAGSEILSNELRLIIEQNTSILKTEGTDEDDPTTEPDEFTALSPIIGSDTIKPFDKTDLFRWSSNPSIIWAVKNRYVNPYLQAFGGYPLGLPFDYENGLGLTIGFGTPYSGPMETDFVKLGLHFAFLELSVTSRVKELVKEYSSNSNIEVGRSTLIGNWNNLYAPHVGAEIGLDLIPYLRLSYFFTIDTLDNETDPPVIVRNLKTGSPMPNNVVNEKGYFGAEVYIRNLQVLRSSFFSIYAARYFGEYHMGFLGREMMINNFNFDTRLNLTLAGEREFQILFELYFNDLFKGFGNRSVGLGPSFRFGKTPNENFGVITALLNMRIKVGDFFDPNLY